MDLLLWVKRLHKWFSIGFRIIESVIFKVGIHSAKFDAERLPANVLHATKRLNIKHPVLNDPEASLWGRLGIHCWPTLVLLSRFRRNVIVCLWIFYVHTHFLGPEGKPLLVLAGEGHRDILFRAVSVALSYFRELKTLKTGVDEDIIVPIEEKIDVNSLRFPGKVFDGNTVCT